MLFKNFENSKSTDPNANTAKDMTGNIRNINFSILLSFINRNQLDDS